MRTSQCLHSASPTLPPCWQFERRLLPANAIIGNEITTGMVAVKSMCTCDPGTPVEHAVTRTSVAGAAGPDADGAFTASSFAVSERIFASISGFSNAQSRCFSASLRCNRNCDVESVARCFTSCSCRASAKLVSCSVRSFWKNFLASVASWSSR